MQQFMVYKSERSAQLNKHPFVRWLAADNVGLDRKFDFAPVMIWFIMAFRDMNLWVLRFDADHADHFKDILDGNTREDETHSALFVEEWAKLRLDEKLRWQASDTLAWMFLSPYLEPFREYQVEFIRLAIDDEDDPMLRFAHSEAGEACGHIFFKASVIPAEKLTEATGIDYRYFGRYHLERELGHVIESEEEFEEQELDPIRNAATLELGRRMFDIFDGIFDAFHRYVVDFVEEDTHPLPQQAEWRLPRTPQADVDIPTTSSRPHPSVWPVKQWLDERRWKASKHPFYRRLREGPEQAADKLRGFLPLWTMDVLGYRDLQHYVFRYGAPTTDAERLINAWVSNLETHSSLFLKDWRALGLDQLLGWGARETVEFCFLDPAMDVHRRNIIAFTRLGLRHPDPVLRFWLMYALETSGESFFHSTRLVAQAAEVQGVGPLDYLSDRHDAAHVTNDDAIQLIQRRFLAEPLSLAQALTVRRLIDVVYDALEEQLYLSLEALETNRFQIPGLQPPTATGRHNNRQVSLDGSTTASSARVTSSS